MIYGTTDIAHENMPLWVKDWPGFLPQEKIEVNNKKAKIFDLEIFPLKYNFTVEAKEKTEIKINTIYFPGWKIFANKIEIPINYQNNQGIMKTEIEPGIYQFEVKFTDNLIRKIGNTLSLSTLIFLFVNFILRIKKRIVKLNQ